MDIHELVIGVLGSGGFYKILLDVARAMPPLPDDKCYICKWTYNALQLVCGNTDKVAH